MGVRHFSMRKSKSKFIYDNLVCFIMDDNTKLGDKLPTEVELCEKYDVSRSTAREALSMLSAKGFIEIRKGSGSYVKSKNNTEDSILNIDNNVGNFGDFMEIRTSFETLAVKLFIKQFKISNLNRLKETEDSFELAVKEGNVNNMAMYDEMFHRCIFAGTGNALLIKIGEVLITAFSLYRVKTFKNVENRKDAVTAHRQIIDSLARKDTDDAVVNMSMHLKTSYNNAIRD